MHSKLFWFFAISGMFFWLSVVVGAVLWFFLWVISERPEPPPTGPTVSVAEVDEGLKKIEEDPQDWVRSYGGTE